MWVIVRCIILHSDGLEPGLVTGRNEVTYGKWIPDIQTIKWFPPPPFSFQNSLWLFTHRCTSYPLVSSAGGRGVFCSLAISHKITMSWASATSIAVTEQGITGRQDFFQYVFVTRSAPDEISPALINYCSGLPADWLPQVSLIPGFQCPPGSLPAPQHRQELQQHCTFFL